VQSIIQLSSFNARSREIYTRRSILDAAAAKSWIMIKVRENKAAEASRMKRMDIRWTKIVMALEQMVRLMEVIIKERESLM
jgi:hypothetical protein